MPRSPIILLGIPVLLLAVVGLVYVWVTSPKPPVPMQDFVEYWSAGVVNANRGNPYDPDQLLPVQQLALDETDSREAMMMWNPPWALVLVTPIGLLPAKLAHAVWLALQLSSVVLAARFLWRSYDGPREAMMVAFVVALSFAPFFILMRYGQISGFCLLGLAGFIDAHRRGRPVVAGMFATLTTLKPHLLFAFGLVLILDALVTRRGRRALLGAGLALSLAAMAAWLMNPDIYEHYRNAGWTSSSGSHTSPKDWYQPLVSFYLRSFCGEWNWNEFQIIYLGPFWVQFVPTVVTAMATAVYWFRRHYEWDWTLETPRLIFASVLFAAYGAWIFDLVVLLVPVVQAAVWLTRRWPRRTAGIIMVLVAHMFLELITTTLQFWTQAFAGVGVPLHALVYFSPATLLLYLAAGRVTRPRGS